VFVHPTTRGFADPVFSEQYLWNLVGNPMETTITAAQLVLSGTLERHSGLNVLLAHGGGAIVALRGRLRRGQDAVAAAAARLREPAAASLARLRVDTVVHDPALLRALVELIGADRVLLGSDRPFDMADPDPVATVRRAGLDSDSEELILSVNASRLLDSAAHARRGTR
jgi:aminocarboxymuconate-semialdehyde decarboxylase